MLRCASEGATQTTGGQVMGLLASEASGVSWAQGAFTPESAPDQKAEKGCLMTENDGPRYFNDDGTEFNPGLQLTPDLCASCVKNKTADGDEQVVCNLTGADQNGDEWSTRMRVMKQTRIPTLLIQPNLRSVDRQ